MLKNDLNHHSYKQSGAVLITGLIFLVILTMIVLTVLRSGTLEERMASNTRNKQVALQAAEAVLRDAEISLLTAPTAPFDPFDITQFTNTCTNGLCYQPNAASTWQTIDWGSAAVTRSFASVTSNIPTLTTQPRYIVEIILPPKGTVGHCEPGLAQITARGVGKDGSTAVVQSTVRFKVSTNICNY
ncbi:MAG: PilX N-terminal domain-containing pilus assembly protein [Undibacterium sp.]|uniref:pilus assembly PilX family protein n=1 Tax=Undibacterium sp. TaxID=1914977 RepID=UPI002715EF4E|nr:PilX N-terminal domain-containing pilus assembly protein [Undibacterium sp.]MDO8651301.1 PilX N-terminal domain-containing pilus assembly protein [Undibacterium sp.]